MRCECFPRHAGKTHASLGLWHLFYFSPLFSFSRRQPAQVLNLKREPPIFILASRRRANTRLGVLALFVRWFPDLCARAGFVGNCFPILEIILSVSSFHSKRIYMNVKKKQKHVPGQPPSTDEEMHELHTCVLRSWLSCLRRSVAFCCRPLRWSCICKRLTLLTALEGGGGIRARGADGVLAANHRAGQHEGSTRGEGGGGGAVSGSNRLVSFHPCRFGVR